MKTKYVIASVFTLVVSTTAMAQKSELATAKTEYDKYTVVRTGKIAQTSLGTAKESIDKAAANDKTAQLPQTYALKAAIYGSLANDTTQQSRENLITTAQDAYKKAQDADTKGENKKLIDDAKIQIANYQLNKGVKDYQSGKYDLAYTAFDNYRQSFPEDTNAILYTGLAAANAKNNDAAISNYKKLVTTKYSKSLGVYQDLVTLYLQKKDTASAIKVMDEATKKYPKNAELAKREIELNIQAGNKKEVTQKLETAIANDPKNKALYYYAGLTYSSAKDYAKAQEYYQKALDIDPNYFEANLNMGFVIMSPAIDIFNSANKLPANKQKEYLAAIAKSNAMFTKAEPYILKATEVNPTSVDALNNLKTVYIGKKEDAKAAAVQKRIDALKK
ncbi:tetratricopeptide repeat protein [Mucilaginibacter arboris]|uniref:Tetratricopeptide repeat protein n=1 Tax=Mucilaginibacter arboris TaxID=2682090 RepID=A0A7K1SYX5_9SPHI|nr:tetratricopeptide repeat protein [Mucilaginibacter arboris]MVN22511.1 tetratricopeptide repeat protein [Mucilaginibacter arboris]